MISIFNDKYLKYLACIMVVIQGMLIALGATFYLNAEYVKSIKSYPRSGLYLNLKTIPENKVNDTLLFLDEYAKTNGIFYVRTDIALSNNGGVAGYTLGLGGDYSTNKDVINLSYMNTGIINFQQIQLLVDSSQKDLVIGLDISTLKSKGKVPKFKFGDNIVFKKLDNLVEDTKTINGEYKIVGLDATHQSEFLTSISAVTGVDSDVFFDGKSGYSIDNSFKEIILWLVLISHSMVFLGVLIVMSIRSLSVLGKLLLQGWSRFNVAITLYKPLWITAFVTVPIFILYGLFLSDMTFVSVVYLSIMIGLGLLNFIIVLLFVSISSIFIFLISPINAIRERLPKKRYIGITLVAYLVFNLLIVCMCVYLDEPYREIQKNAEISTEWADVSRYQILEKIAIGEDASSFNYQSKVYLEDFYNWYASIAGCEGVNLVNTSYISNDILNNYRTNKLCQSVPTRPFWLFKISPNYLKKLGISIDEKIVNQAEQGVRVYLLPKDLSDDESTVFQSWAKENDTRSIQADDIDTVFNKEQKFTFIKYGFEKAMFTWSTTHLNSLTTKQPIILITTPKNMTFRESESLSAIGIENNYIKLEQNAVDHYANNAYLSKFNLSDNNIKFTPIDKFVDGLQKNLWQTIQLFFLLLLAITCIVIALLLTFVAVFQNAYKEKIAIKKFLGYGLCSTYKVPVALIGTALILDLLSIGFFRSKIGIVYIAGLSILQILIVIRVIHINQFKRLNSFLKS